MKFHGNSCEINETMQTNYRPTRQCRSYGIPLTPLLIQAVLAQ